MYRLTAEFDVSGQVGPKQIARVDILHSEDGDLAKSVFHKLSDIPEDERGFISLELVRTMRPSEVVDSWRLGA